MTGPPSPSDLPSGLLETARWRLPKLEPGVPVARPRWTVERLANLLLRALAPRLEAVGEPIDPPPQLEPYQRLVIPRRGRSDALDGLHFPATGSPERGAVLLAPPWVAQGQAYLFRRGRIPALRAAGFQVLTFDFGGFGRSGRAHPGFADRDVDDAFAALRRVCPGLPVHYWGVSAGGYWGHLLLTRNRVTGAFFEQVFDHPIGWSRRVEPHATPFYLFFRRVLSGAYSYLHLNSHAGHRNAEVFAYVGGEEDPGVPPKVTRRLARLFDGRCEIVPGAGHLDAIRRAAPRVIELALDTFAHAEER